jgi:hypothetical protein
LARPTMGLTSLPTTLARPTMGLARLPMTVARPAMGLASHPMVLTSHALAQTRFASRVSRAPRDAPAVAATPLEPAMRGEDKRRQLTPINTGGTRNTNVGGVLPGMAAGEFT